MDTPDYLSYGAPPAAGALLADLADSHRRTMQLFSHWQENGQPMPKLAIVNPPHWEFGHVGWFQEFWVHRRGDSRRPSRLARADALFNSSIVPHHTRWDLPLPATSEVRDYLDSVHEDTAALLQQGEPDAATAYFVQLALFHQDMHNEAFAYSWQTVGWAWPEALLPYDSAPPARSGDLAFDSAVIEAGARPGAGFAFDNEKWAHQVTVPAFAISAAPVTQRDYLEFVEQDPAQRTPRHWRRSGARWEQRSYDRWQPLALDQPVCHVSAEEAEAWCRWRGRRLPTEAEWLRFAQEAGTDAFAGVWEWTASSFAPFPGFSPDPYADYSRPWFDGSYRVLKGASGWTPPRLRRAAFRNFYQPSRGDMFCGFRTCAADSR